MITKRWRRVRHLKLCFNDWWEISVRNLVWHGSISNGAWFVLQTISVFTGTRPVNRDVSPPQVAQAALGAANSAPVPSADDISNAEDDKMAVDSFGNSQETKSWPRILIFPCIIDLHLYIIFRYTKVLNVERWTFALYLNWMWVCCFDKTCARHYCQCQCDPSRFTGCWISLVSNLFMLRSKSKFRFCEFSSSFPVVIICLCLWTNLEFEFLRQWTATYQAFEVIRSDMAAP